MDVRGCCTSLCVGAPPFLFFVPFWCVACRCRSWAWARLAFSFALGVLLMFSLSSSPLSFGAPVVVASLSWSPGVGSVLGSVVLRTRCGLSLSCRVYSSVPRARVSALVSFLKSSLASGVPVSLGVRGGWAGSSWFCAARPVPVAGSPDPAPAAPSAPAGFVLVD